MSGAPLLAWQDLRLSFRGEEGETEVLVGVDLELRKGETLALVGESGSGKSATCLAALGLLGPNARRTGGAILREGEPVWAEGVDHRAALRGRFAGAVFQDPMSSLNPFLRVGDQVAEGLVAQRGLSRRAARDRAVALLEEVGIPDAARRARAHPHELSGGMRQRVMIAMALALEPRVLVADEPTTALDVTTQARILGLLDALRRTRGTAILLVTHDFGVAAGLADRVAVLYAGRVVEEGSTAALLAAPFHPYARALRAAVPEIRAGAAPHPPRGIPGTPPRPGERPTGCAFHPRCPWVFAPCAEADPPARTAGEGRVARCHLEREEAR
ncbi:MAG: ABC transporter ATP-binding protein [Planctomycetota bacterium]